MARAYYGSGDNYTPWTADMVGGIARYHIPMFNQCYLCLGTYAAQSTRSGDGFTIVSTVTGGYNGQISQQTVDILTFRFGNGSGILYDGYQATLPASNTSVTYYYSVSGGNITVWCNNTSFNSQNVYYAFIGRNEGWTQSNATQTTKPSNLKQFTRVSIVTSYDPEVVVSSSQPSNTNAKLWFQV